MSAVKRRDSRKQVTTADLQRGGEHEDLRIQMTNQRPLRSLLWQELAKGKKENQRPATPALLSKCSFVLPPSHHHLLLLSSHYPHLGHMEITLFSLTKRNRDVKKSVFFLVPAPPTWPCRRCTCCAAWRQSRGQKGGGCTWKIVATVVAAQRCFRRLQIFKTGIFFYILYSISLVWDICPYATTK